MNLSTSRLLVPAALAAAALAQGPDYLVTYSQTEQTLSGSGGTVLQVLRPNEIAHLEWSNGPCLSPSAEKWSPRTCFHTMAGDENGDLMYWNPTLFNRIDALCGPISTTPIAGGTNPRTVFWSPEAPMGLAISGGPGLRPGDVGRIVQNAGGPGQVEYFMRLEQFNQALGLPPLFPLDIDAICYQPGVGVFFSVDQDVPAFTFCGPTLIRDGDVVTVPDWAITWTPDFRVGAVLPVSAAVVYTEAQIDAFVVAAQVTDRFGNCIPAAIDLEALEIDWSGAMTTSIPCAGAIVTAPDFLFTIEAGTGASVLTTAGGGQIHNHLCGAAGRQCGGGPTFGPQMGIMPASTTVGAASFVNALMSTFTWRYVLEAQQPVITVPAAGLPAGSSSIDVGSPFLWNFVYVELVPPTVPWSITLPPWWSLFCFPDLYTWSLNFYMPVPAFGGFGSFPLPAIPGGFSGKAVFQSLAFGGSGIEVSTPVVLDIQ